MLGLVADGPSSKSNGSCFFWQRGSFHVHQWALTIMDQIKHWTCEGPWQDLLHIDNSWCGSVCCRGKWRDAPLFLEGRSLPICTVCRRHLSLSRLFLPWWPRPISILEQASAIAASYSHYSRDGPNQTLDLPSALVESNYFLDFSGMLPPSERCG